MHRVYCTNNINMKLKSTSANVSGKRANTTPDNESNPQTRESESEGGEKVRRKNLCRIIMAGWSNKIKNAGERGRRMSELDNGGANARRTCPGGRLSSENFKEIKSRDASSQAWGDVSSAPEVQSEPSHYPNLDVDGRAADGDDSTEAVVLATNGRRVALSRRETCGGYGGAVHADGGREVIHGNAEDVKQA